MLDFVKCTHNGAGGAGALALALIDGFPLPTDILGASGSRRYVYVAIEYTDATKTKPLQIERGRCVLNLATLGMVREQIDETWSGNAANTSSPAALNFGNTAANIEIFFPATSTSQHPAQPIVPAPIGGSDGFVPFNTRVCIDGNATGVTLQAGRRHYMPAEYSYGKPLLTFAVHSTGTVSGNVRVAVYEWGADGLPGNLVKELTVTAQIAVGATSGRYSITIAPYSLPPGWYYVMIQTDAGVSLLHANPATHCGAGQIGFRDIMALYKDGSAYGPAPAAADTVFTGVFTRSSFPQLALFVK